MNKVRFDLATNSLVASQFLETTTTNNAMLHDSNADLTVPTLIETSSYTDKFTLTPAGILTASRFVEYLSNWKYSMVVSSSLDLNNNTASFDSYDSSDPNYSTNGLYDVTKRKANAYVVFVTSSNGLIDSLGGTITSSICGNIGGPIGSTAGSLITIADYSIGDASWVNGGSSGVETGHFLNNAFQDNIPFGGDVYLPASVFTPTPFPYNSGFTPPTAIIGGVVYNHALTSSIDYYLASTLSGKTIVTANGCRLVLPSGINMSGTDLILMYNSTASIKIYSGASVAGAVTIGGNAISSSTAPVNVRLYCSQSVTLLSMANPSNAMGMFCVEAPNASVTLNGGGHITSSISGYIIAKAIKLNGNFNFHMDESTIR